MQKKRKQQTQAPSYFSGITLLGVVGYSVAGALLGALVGGLLYCIAEFEHPGKPENGWLILVSFLLAAKGAFLGFVGSALVWLLQAGSKLLSPRK